MKYIMLDEYEKITSKDLLRVIDHRGAVSHELGCALLQIGVATTEEEMKKPIQFVLCLTPETAEKLISSLQQSLSILRQSN